jgi:hypothetical protein
MMPSGLNQALSQQDLIDLVEYLSSLKKNWPALGGLLVGL